MNGKVNTPNCLQSLSSINEKIKEVQFHRDLGIYLSSDSSWQKHIEYDHRNEEILIYCRHEISRNYVCSIYLTDT